MCGYILISVVMLSRLDLLMQDLSVPYANQILYDLEAGHGML